MADRLAEAIGHAAVESRVAPSGRAVRSDGWTPERVCAFLKALAACGVVTEAARAVGMSKRSAYNLRKRAGPIGDAWNGALEIAREALSETVQARALNGCVKVIVRDGKVWGERHYFDNRHSMAVLDRLDRQHLLLGGEADDALIVADNFEEFLDLLCAGDDGAAEAFIAAHRPGPKPQGGPGATPCAAGAGRQTKPE